MRRTAREGVPEWLDVLDYPVLRRWFGNPTVDRGDGYERRGAVVNLRYGPGQRSVLATVHGSRRYTTVVSSTAPPGAGPPALGPHEVSSTCSCPVGRDCKHVVAVILAARAGLDQGDHAPVPAPSRWEAALAPLLGRTGAGAAEAEDGDPLALLLETPSGTSRSGRRSEPALRLRPLALGRSGAWVRTGISWVEVQYAAPRANARHRAALAAFAGAQAGRHPYYAAATQWIHADELGGNLWRLLEEAAAAGVQLRTGTRAERPVHLLAAPARVVVDMTRDAGGGVALRAEVVVPGTPGEPIPIGAPAHAVLVHRPDAVVVARLEHPLTTAAAALLHRREEVVVPAEDVARFLAGYYPALSRLAEVGSSDGSVALPEVRPPHLALLVEVEPEHRVALRWSFRYPVGSESIDVELGGSGPTGAGEGGRAPDTVVRDRETEEALLAGLDLLDAVPGLRRAPQPWLPPQPVPATDLAGWEAVTFLTEVLPDLQERPQVEVTVVGTPLDYVELTGRPLVSVSTTEPADEVGTGGSQQDWFDLGIAVSVDGHEVHLATLLTALGRGERRLLLADGSWFSLERPELQALRRIVEEARALVDDEDEAGGLRVSRYQVGLWEELVELGVVAEQSERWARSVGGLLALDSVPHPEPPDTLCATLRPYQLDGYQWLSFLWDHQLGGILADDMGLGKTLQTLAMGERARERGTLTPEAPMLVVAPTSVVAAWRREAERFAPKLTVAAITQTVGKSGAPLTETTQGAHLVVTSYALLRIDAEHYDGLQWGAVVLDEAQAVKNHQSRSYQVVRGLRAPVKLAITGTPLENSLMDLWSLLSIVAPGLFPTPQRFSDLFRKPIESGESPELLATLRRRIRPLMLRRTKDAVAADLPPKVEQVVTVPLNPAHRRIYDTHLQRERQRILGLLHDVDRNRIAILSALTKLRQLALDVHLVLPDSPAGVRSSKVDALIEQVAEVAAEGHRILVFSQFTRFLGRVRERLVAEGIEYVYLDGRTRDRPRRIAEFTEGTAPVFLISLKAGGSGLTLTEADYVFVLDPWWNPAVEAQAVDRAHRIGQDKPVMVYRMVSEGTIEEKVVALQERKRQLFSRVVDDGGLMSAPLTADDIRGLLDG